MTETPYSEQFASAQPCTAKKSKKKLEGLTAMKSGIYDAYSEQFASAQLLHRCAQMGPKNDQIGINRSAKKAWSFGQKTKCTEYP